MLYIIGLGNPGEKYTYTRHNVAWLVLDQLFPDGWNHHKYMNAHVRNSNHGLYIKPETFMNNSGEVVHFLKKEMDIQPEHIVVMYDDLDLPFGVIKIAHNRGDGGHNGVKSIVQHLGSKECIRIRIGISKQLDDGRLAKPNVLGNFSHEEREIINEKIAAQIERIIKSLHDNGLEKTMNVYN